MVPPTDVQRTIVDAALACVALWARSVATGVPGSSGRARRLPGTAVRWAAMFSWTYDPEAVEARTPADRDRFADLLRTAAVLLVVLGHWLVAAVLERDGMLVAGQVLQYVPETRLLTWVFQVLPLFFFVGGSVNAASWRRSLAGGEGWPRWVRRRARRLLAPLVPVLAVWVVVPRLLARVLDQGLVEVLARSALIPLWFLVVYLLVVGLTPLTHALHRRLGPWVLVAVAVVVGAVDAAHRAGIPAVGDLNYLLVWGAVHQLGYLWGDRRFPQRPAGNLTLAAAAAAAAVLLIVGLGYPGSMVAVQGAAQNNTDPPSLALLAYAIAQVCLVVAAHRPAQRWLRDPHAWAPVTLIGGVALTLFLWHMTALVAVAATVHLTGWWPPPERIDGGWWATRPLWLLACGLVLAMLVAAFARFERQPEPAPDDSVPRAALGLGAFVTGMAMIARTGIYTPERTADLPLVAVTLVVAGLAALGALRPRSLLDGRVR